MNKGYLMYFGALIFPFLVAFFIFSEQTKENSPGVKNVSVQEAKEMIEKDDVFVLDVRTPDEFNSSRIRERP